MLEVADPGQLVILPFVWSACGPGCSTSPSKVLDTDDTVFNGMATARVEGDDVIVRFGTTWGSHYKMIAVRRLSNGALLAAARAPGQTTTSCAMMGFAASAPHLLPFVRGDGAGPDGFSTSGTVVAAFIGVSGLVWSPPSSGVSLPLTSAFENDLGWGMGLYDGSLHVQFPPESGTFPAIDQGSYPSHSTVGWGSLVISNPALSASPDEVIRAWEPDRPSRTIVAQSDTDIPSVALSETTMVWAGVHGPQRWDGGYAAAELYWTPFPAGKDSVPVMGGTSLPAIAGLVELQTWGDYAAVIGTDQTKRRVIFVVRLSDGHLWTIGPRPGVYYIRLLAVTPTDILVGEIDDSGDPTLAWQMQYLTRYALARLDDLAAAW